MLGDLCRAHGAACFDQNAQKPFSIWKFFDQLGGCRIDTRVDKARQKAPPSWLAPRGGPEAGLRWSARSEARTNDLDAGEDRRRVSGEEGSLWSGHDNPLGICTVDVLHARSPRLISVLGAVSGDMMSDGVNPA